MISADQFISSFFRQFELSVGYNKTYFMFIGYNIENGNKKFELSNDKLSLTITKSCTSMARNKKIK